MRQSVLYVENINIMHILLHYHYCNKTESSHIRVSFFKLNLLYMVRLNQICFLKEDYRKLRSKSVSYFLTFDDILGTLFLFRFLLLISMIPIFFKHLSQNVCPQERFFGNLFAILYASKQIWQYIFYFVNLFIFKCYDIF